jgi:hypothetical protein
MVGLQPALDLPAAQAVLAPLADPLQSPLA